jgi:hypothetical protein
MVDRETSGDARTPEPAAGEGLPDPTLADVVTQLWRAETALRRLGDTGVPAPVRHARRHLETAFDALADAGVEVQTHDGDPFDSGQSIVAVAFEPDAGVDRERVTQTIRPTIYRRGHLIQHGQVAVATPAAGGQEERPDEEPPGEETNGDAHDD